LDIQPSSLKKEKPPTVKQVIGSMPKIRSGLSRRKDSGDLWKNIVAAASESEWLQSNDKCGKLIKSVVKSAIKEIKSSDLKTLETSYKPPRVMRSWYHDKRLNISTSHEARSHMESDLYRYLFVSSYGAALNVSPTLSDFPIELLPAHKNVQAGCKVRIFSDRFRVQLRSKVSTTITSHISKDGHYFIHYDPAQCRSLTVREAARLQTFPDNYFFEGPRTAQYHQVGNAVPPYLAAQIAEIVKEILDRMPEG
jgi:DNA (cytosine-5)-methyltransferase 1